MDVIASTRPAVPFLFLRRALLWRLEQDGSPSQDHSDRFDPSNADPKASVTRRLPADSDLLHGFALSVG
ncbi:hypothetical protein QQ054_14890 [Oscillatoria amoena NRMC-F 0135]|nr:hypothetical protein [Oscillatoria amoena NRMC-F 0135]